MNQFVVVPAELSDAREIESLVNSAYRGDTSRVGWTTEADYLDGQRIDEAGLKELISSPEIVILCLKDASNSQILACVELAKFEANSVLLGMLSVNPKMQNQGLGAKLIKSAESFVKEHFQTQKIIMKVISIRSELIAYYERKGYKRLNQFDAFPYGDSRFGIPKRDDLEFVRMEKTL